MRPFEVTELPNIDLISPFPLQQIPRLNGWLHCYKTIIMTDLNPQSAEDWEAYHNQLFQSPEVKSWGIIDKNNLTKSKHEAPLVGMVMFQQDGPFNGYFHVASNRSAWGKKFVDEAGSEVIQQIFKDIPSLLRVSAAILDVNAPAKALARRLGFQKEGLLKDVSTQQGKPVGLALFGLTRREYQPPTAKVELEEVKNE